MRRFLLLFCLALGALRAAAADLPDLLSERSKCVVAVEYYADTEVERRSTIAYGTVVDDQGTVILGSSAIDPRIPAKQLKEFRMYLPGDPYGTPCEYLGQDALTGWHFVRAPAKLRSQLIPVTKFAGRVSDEPRLADSVWGVALRNKEEDFTPYILQSHVALIQALPQKTAIAQQEIAGPGLPVFTGDGTFAGLASSSFGQTYLQFSNVDRAGTPVMLVNVEESSAFLLASEVLPYLTRIPKDVSGRPLAWLGAYGLEPMDREVAAFLKLKNQSAAVVSEVLEGSPAEKAGLKAGDIILATDGHVLPHFAPDRVVVDYVDRQVSLHQPGDTLTLSVLRGTERVELSAVLGDEPKLIREAQRKLFERVGFLGREFVYGDAVARRVKTSEIGGLVVHFVKPNSPADIAGLRPDDWIKEVDGAEVKSFADGVAKITAIESDLLRSEVVLLVSRGGDTAVLRVKLR